MSLFGDERKRNINLGGSSTAAAQSQSALFDQVKQRRELRLEQKRRNDAAVRIQSQWRGTLSKQRLRAELRRTFDGDVTGLTGMRCLVLLGQDDEALGMWCSAMAAADWSGAMTTSWVVLARQLSSRLLWAVATKHANALLYLQTLEKLLQHPQSSVSVLQYLLPRAFYSLLSTCILAYPKTSPNVPLLVSFSTIAFTLFPPTSIEFAAAANDLFDHIVTLSILPYRIPLTSLTQLGARFPFAYLSVVHLTRPLSVEARVNLVANLLALVPAARHAQLKSALPAYIRILSDIMESLPVGVFDPDAHQAAEEKGTKEGVDSDDEDITVTVVPHFSSARAQPLPHFDSRTLKRLKTLPSVPHLTSLITHAKSSKELVRFFIALTGVWPVEKKNVLSLVSSGWIREIYRFAVRTSPLGKDQNSVLDQSNAEEWPSMLLLADVYTELLSTMGDDEFFGTGNSKTRNPLNLDEVTQWTKQLLNIAYVLYWRDKDGGRTAASDVCPGLRVSWDTARDKVTNCLVAIQTRDTRKSFVPSGHWHVLHNQADLQGFVDAAAYEEEMVASESGVDFPANRSRKQIADMSPRLGILKNIPFVIPFEVRVSMFRAFVEADRIRSGRPRFMHMDNRQVVRIRRDHVAEDGFNKLGGDDKEGGMDMKSLFQIEFIDQFGNVEAGIDGGGVFKEFFTSLCQEVFDTNRGLWVPNSQQELYPNPMSFATESNHLKWYHFIGKILGKAMYEGILVDVAFAPFFLAKFFRLLHIPDELASLDEQLYKGLLFLRHYEGDVSELALNFDLIVDEFGEKKTIELIHGGSSIPVTKQNRKDYITAVTNYKLTVQIRKQSNEFFQGLEKVIKKRWLRMFNPQEIQILMGGVDTLIDFKDLRANTKYGGLYDDQAPGIQMFWSVIETFNQEERRALLRFATSCSRPPLLGFKELVPNFCIRDSGMDEQRLPTSSTCVNLLKMPMYKSARVMREKLLKAIMSGAGFDLS